MLPVPAIVLRPSRRLVLWVRLLYASVAIVCLSLPCPILARLALLAIVVLDAAWQHRRLRNIYGFTSLRVNREHQLQMQQRSDGAWLTLPVCAPCHLLPGLIILPLRHQRRVRRVLLEPGMMEREEWRCLRLWMKWRLPEQLPVQPGLWSRVRRVLTARRRQDRS